MEKILEEKTLALKNVVEKNAVKKKKNLSEDGGEGTSPLKDAERDNASPDAGLNHNGSVCGGSKPWSVSVLSEPNPTNHGR